MTIKKNLLLELSQYAANTKINKDNFETEDTKFIPEDEFGVIPANTRLQIAIATNSVDPENVRLSSITFRELEDFETPANFPL